MTNSFEQSLDHAPVIALINVDDAEQAFRAGTACWAGGFRLVAIAASIATAPDLVSALGSRSDLLVGLWDVQTREELDTFDLNRVAFVFGTKAAVQAAQISGVPSVLITSKTGLADNAESALCIPNIERLDGIATVAEFKHETRNKDLFVHGEIGGDECASYLDAGARALILTNALMSPSLLNSGDYRSIRNYAAAVHQAATHLSRNTQEKTA
tara:strand:+ start:1494 stop:2132 length:639 start_codon:yes stop_codon:yes gene_type:complete